MKILLTGATGYIAQRLLPVLVQDGHDVVCCVRDKLRFQAPELAFSNVQLVEVDFLKPETLRNIPPDIDAAYYLIHSMASPTGDFAQLEATAAQNFVEALRPTAARQIIYLSGIVNQPQLSKHLRSRQQVEHILTSADIPLTTLRAGIIVGSGSASFEIIRDLVEKLPVMVAPRWLHTRCQPIAIRNVVAFLAGVLLRPETYQVSYDIGGPDVLSYKEMLLQFAQVRGLKRTIVVVPVMTPKLSSYWLYFVTATSYPLACHLVDSMKVEVVGSANELDSLLGIELIPYKEAIYMAFDKIEQNEVISSWKDAMATPVLRKGLAQYIEVPVKGCFKDHRRVKVADGERTLDKIWSIGGQTGWYYGNWLWALRGLMDQMVGGVGLRRGRRSPSRIKAGDALDFWRVLLASRSQKRLLLYAEMKLPGEAWLEFRLHPDNTLEQTATFRPLGIWGRLYWYAVLPFHGYIFEGMIRQLARP
ncbi:SDR family oxidoreductase [Spirosoma linguale]|uniref:NAD-dependent epimerase/dehydratase n=1 Tax=Spirosoma linguale (strain ATCC 33905 / DSM 74 / LMG 10896 / Claus 1) TaxID=504472 RepID=D2QEZ3_SPILD|nr:NAD-dependent epimerase/dehydratase [Spirosoma linguale DSM 74]